MKRKKVGLVAVVIASMAITVAVVGAQPPTGNGGFGGDGRSHIEGVGRGVDLQVIADALGIDTDTLQADLQAGKTVADIATEQNVDLSKVIDAVVAQRTEQLTQAVTDGTLTQAQADAQIALLQANLNVQFSQSLTARDGRNAFPGMRGSDELTVIAEALGIDADTLQADLQAGKSVADIATEQNVDLSTVVEAMVAQRTEELTQAVTDGTLTQAQADAQIALLKANLETQFSQTWDTGRGPRDFNGDGGPMGPDGQGNGPMGQNQGGRPGGRPGNGGPMGPNGNGNDQPMPPDGQGGQPDGTLPSTDSSGSNA